VLIPKGASAEYNGKIVTKAELTPVPVDRAPYPPHEFFGLFTCTRWLLFGCGATPKGHQAIYPTILVLRPVRGSFLELRSHVHRVGLSGHGT